jgi:hypothetical protein
LSFLSTSIEVVSYVFLAWKWFIMTPPKSQTEDGLGSHARLVGKEKIEEVALHAEQRAKSVRSSAYKVYSLYESGGWKSLFEENVNTSSETDVSNNGEPISLCTEQYEPLSTAPLCPSSQVDTENAVIFGIVEGTLHEPKVAYLKEPQEINESILELSGSVAPTEMFRIADSCQEKACQHYDGSKCQLAVRIVEQLNPVVESLPACQIRSNCRWWKQEGKEACFRCPQVVTDTYYTSEQYRQTADPDR